MAKSNKNVQPKREYRKPGLRIVKLAAKEVLGDGCKVSEQAIGSLTNTCSNIQCSISPGS